MFQLRFTTLVEAPLTVAFDVARTLGRPWGTPLEEVVSVRPVRDVYAAGPGSGWRWLTHSRRFSATGEGTLVDEQIDWDTGLPGVVGRLVDQVVLRRRVLRAMQAHLDAYAAAGPRLRAAIGSSWRGTIVYVNGLRVQLIDWCQCYQGEPNEKLLDLYYDVYARTGTAVTIRW